MIKPEFDFDKYKYDSEDPNPWYALYLDQSTPLRPSVKKLWLQSTSSLSRQFLLPIAKPFSRLTIILVQVIKAFSPIDWRASKFLHQLIVFGLKTFVRADANYLILRHFHVGSEILNFIYKNVDGADVSMLKLRPRSLDDLKDEFFLKHDLNLYNFVIQLNQQIREKGLNIKAKENPDFSMVTEGEFDIEMPKQGWLNFIDLETAIELYTPIYQFFLTDNDFWRATNSLQLDETVGLYAATILNSQAHLVLINNKHPLVPLITLSSGYRLVLHGLSSEMGHWYMVMKKKEQMRRLNEPNKTA